MSILESVTSELISKSLDIALHNHKVIANNIANANVDGFSARRIDFAEALGELRQLVKTGSSDERLSNALASTSSEPVPSLEEVVTKIAIDDEIVKLTQNTLHYQALLKAKKELGQITKLAITGGKA